jgi:histidinol-phosphate aminotransferase
MSYAALPNPGAGLRLHLNENTAGCSPAVLAALRSIERLDTAFYPDYGPITSATERWFDVLPGWVQLTNGLDEGLHVVAQAAARGRLGASAIIVEPAFEMYAACANAAGLRSVHVVPEPDFAFPLQAILSSVTPATRLINLTDPNNPTGLAIPAGCVSEIAETAPHAFVLVDEAYAEFSGRSAVGPLLDRHRNLVVGRTFAKAHGLAALRVGALVAHPDTLAAARQLLPPYSLNICAVRALGAALNDGAYLDWYVGESLRSRQLIYDFCDANGLFCWRSQGNFVLVRIGDDATDVVGLVAARGVFIRDRSMSPGCAGCVRITAGVVDHTRACLSVLEDALASRRR